MLSIVALGVCAGCAASLKWDASTAPDRPQELRRLAMFEGEWAGTGEVRARGTNAVVTMSGSWGAGLECNGWCLVTREQFEIGESGNARGMAVWTWDPRGRTYRTWWFAESGATAQARGRYDDAERTWILRFTGNGPDGPVAGNGTVRFVEDDTMEWSWTEWPRWDVLRLTRPTRMHGTYMRR